MSLFSQFHFIRPEWLWAFVPAILTWWLLKRRQDRLQGWKRMIAPQLLPHLLVDVSEQGGRIRPLGLLGLLWVLGIIALSGPSWQREPAPFAEEQAVLVVILKLTPSMQAGDVQPSRLVRAVDKIDRLLNRRPDTRTALVAYAGSAHQVMPFTRDHRLIVDFAHELSPDLMPRAGESLLAAIKLADQMITDSGRPGTMLVLADSVDAAQFAELETGSAGRNTAELWAIAAGEDVVPLPGTPAAPALDEPGMLAAADALGGSLEIISIDDRDVAAIDRRIGRAIAEVSTREGERWRDAGYFMLPLLLLLCLFWFRQGWVVRWADR